jgi:hypothetical protein
MVAGFDKYEMRARVFPGLLACLPIAVLVSTFGWKRYPAIAVVIGLIVAAGGTYVMSLIVRHLGRSIQPGLWARWGGPPTTRFLRQRETDGNPVKRTAWRAAVEKATDTELLVADGETANPELADQTIEAAVGQLTRLGQSADYPLIREENINYGFERNLYGVRWYGRGISLACCALFALALAVGTVHLGGEKVANSALVAGLIVDGLFLIGWIFIPSLSRAKDAADRYATQLLDSVVTESRKDGAA